MAARRISYRLSLAVAVPLLVALTGAAVISYSHLRARRQIEQNTAALFRRVSTQAGDEARAHLLRAAPVAELARRLMDEDDAAAGDGGSGGVPTGAGGAGGGVPPMAVVPTGAEAPSSGAGGDVHGAARRVLARRFVAFLRAHPELSWVSYSDEDGAFTGAFHSASGAYRTNLSTRREGKTILDEYDVDEAGAWSTYRHEDDTGYDPRTRPFYRQARDEGRRVFTAPYIFFEQGVPGITCALPRVDGAGRLRGVITVDFDLNRLSSFVAALRLSARGEVFLFTPGASAAAQIVVAHPTTRLVETRGRGAEGKLVSVADVDDRAVQALAVQAAGGRRGFFSFRVDDATWFGDVTAIEIDRGLTWIVGAAAPEADFTADLRRDLRTMLLVNLAVLALAVLAGFALASGVSRPLVGLAAEMGEIGQFKLDDHPRRPSIFSEIQLMHEALARTKGGLRSFAAYVPRDLVRSVLASGQEAVLEGKVKELTIFFSDIAGFTTIAESVKPDALVELLGGYLDDVTTVVAAHHGTVDKFLGDGVMAFWGAPGELADHAALACEAAVRLQRRLDARTTGPRLHTRIGLATGEVVVGNIGSHARMNYTVMGDCVNLAARLEGLNKQYGTTLMISDATRAAAGDRIVARPVDVVAVKGKSHAVRVFELLAVAADPDAVRAPLAALAAHCAAGLDAYLARDFTAAAAAYQAALAVAPGDRIAVALLARCHALAAAPPPPDWTGVVHATEK